MAGGREVKVMVVWEALLAGCGWTDEKEEEKRKERKIKKKKKRRWQLCRILEESS